MDIKLKDGKHFDVSKRKNDCQPHIFGRLYSHLNEAFMITGIMYFTVRVIEIYFHW